MPAASSPLPPAALGAFPATRLRRNRRSDLAIWWREIDRHVLFLVLALMAIGTAAVAAASPASARRLSTAAEQLSDLHFLLLDMQWQIVGLAVMFTASHLAKGTARRVGIIITAISIVLLLLVPVIGSEVNGARRWISAVRGRCRRTS